MKIKSSEARLKEKITSAVKRFYVKTLLKSIYLNYQGSGKYLLDSNGGLQGADDVELAQGDEEPMSFTSQSCKSTEFVSQFENYIKIH